MGIAVENREARRIDRLRNESWRRRGHGRNRTAILSRRDAGSN
jgi:hypothetical protein